MVLLNVKSSGTHIYQRNKGKGKVALGQATKAQRGSRGIALLFL